MCKNDVGKDNEDARKWLGGFVKKIYGKMRTIELKCNINSEAGGCNLPGEELSQMEAVHVLQEILAADRDARNTLAQAGRDKEAFFRDRDNLRRQAEERAAALAEAEVREARAEKLAAAESDRVALDKKQEYRLESLRAYCETKKEEWAETLFRTVVGLDD